MCIYMYIYIIVPRRGRCRPQLKISSIGSNETATQITTSGRCGSSVAQRSYIILVCVCVCVIYCVYYIIIYWITFHPYSSDVLHFAGASLRAPVHLYRKKKKKIHHPHFTHDLLYFVRPFHEHTQMDGIT